MAVPGAGAQGQGDAGTGASMGQGSGESQQGGSEYSLAGEFLQSVPEESRGLLEPWVKKWDAGVTKKFQELHSQYEPYKQLGDLEEVQRAQSLWNLINESPEQVYQMLHEEFGQQQPVGANGAGANGQEGDGNGEQLWGPPEVVEKFQQMENLLGRLAETYLEDRQSQTEAREEEAFESMLESLKEQHGDFDDDWVTLKIAEGMDPEKAVQAWGQMTQSIANKALTPGQQAPNVLGAGGAVPQEQLSLKNAPSSQIKGLVAGMLEQAKGQ